MGKKLRTSRITRVLAGLGVMCAGLFWALPATAEYVQTNLVSDLPGVAAVTDPNLVNPWGIAFSATSPFWVSDNGTGLATLYNSTGTPQSLVVTIPPPAGSAPGTMSTPTGVVFNGSSDFGGFRFIFAAEDGTISGWNAGTSAILQVDNSPFGAVYKGLAINSANNLLYATNFHAGTVDVFDTNFKPTSVSGGFTNPNLPSGFAPFGIRNIGGNLYVTYAVQDAAKHDDVAGPGNGIVDVFDTNGNLLQRLISNGPSSPLNSPWGLALAPGNFGQFSNDLLVGNFGNGTIHAFDPVTGALLGTLMDSKGDAIVNEGLWGLTFGNGGNGGDTDKLFFTAGIPGKDNIEDHGLFGSIAVPLPSTVLLLGSGLAGLLTLVRVRRRRA